MPDHTPTDADRQRDLLADLAIIRALDTIRQTGAPPDEYAAAYEVALHVMGAAPAWLRRAIAAEEVLRSLEWSGGDGEDVCPVCDRPQSEGVHAPDCRLAAAIGVRREPS